MNHMHHSANAPFTASQANRRFWDEDAERYHADHTAYLSSFYWCPEMLHEAEAQLLGDVTHASVLEIGCGSAACTEWLTEHGVAFATGFDISAGMLSRANQSHYVVSRSTPGHRRFIAYPPIGRAMFTSVPSVRKDSGTSRWLRYGLFLSLSEK